MQQQNEEQKQIEKQIEKQVSLVRKIATPIVAVSVVSLTVFGFIISRQSHMAIHESMDTKIESMLNFLATVSASYVKNFDYYALEGFAKQAIKDGDIDSVTFKKDGKVLVDIQDQKQSEEYMVRTAIIGDSNSPIGEVTIGYNNTRVNVTTRRAMMTNVLAIVFEQILIVACMFYVINRASNPVSQFLRKIRGISESGDYRFRFSEQKEIKTNIRELNIVLNEMDHMLNEIQKRDLEIHQANEALERKVQIRTLELQQSVEKLTSMQQILIESSKFAALGEMAAGIAHEINNPLAIISLASTQLPTILNRPNIENREKKLQDYVDRINNAIKRISDIVKGLKTFSRQSSGDPFTLEPLEGIMKETLTFCQERFRTGEIHLKLPDCRDIKIYCRPTEISQILLNLLNNAYDATSELMRSEDKWVTIEVEKRHEYVAITVTNGGPMMPQKIVDKIFQPFFTTKPVGQGTGMGLSISKGIAESHGGTLNVNLSGTHTKFELILPRT